MPTRAQPGAVRMVLTSVEGSSRSISPMEHNENDSARGLRWAECPLSPNSGRLGCLSVRVKAAIKM